MKFIAQITQVLHFGIHKMAIDRQDSQFIFKDLPLPTYVEIEIDETNHAMLYRYRDDATFCGDTWHENLQDAKDQALYEYGIAESAWQISHNM